MGRGREDDEEASDDVLDELAAAHQYTLDLQVLFYSMKQLSAKGAAAAAAAGQQGVAAARGADSHAPAAATAGQEVDQPPPLTADELQAQVRALKAQLAEERTAHQELQAQHAEALGLLRCAGG